MIDTWVNDSQPAGFSALHANGEIQNQRLSEHCPSFHSRALQLYHGSWSVQLSKLSVRGLSRRSAPW